MAGNRRTTRPGSFSVGFSHKQVKVESIDNGRAVCLDETGRAVEVPMNIIRAKGAVPKVGESWFIDREYGEWTFAALVGPPDLPVITGSRTGANVLVLSLIDALVELGFVKDETTP